MRLLAACIACHCEHNVDSKHCWFNVFRSPLSTTKTSPKTGRRSTTRRVLKASYKHITAKHIWQKRPEYATNTSSVVCVQMIHFRSVDMAKGRTSDASSKTKGPCSYKRKLYSKLKTLQCTTELLTKHTLIKTLTLGLYNCRLPHLSAHGSHITLDAEMAPTT